MKIRSACLRIVILGMVLSLVLPLCGQYSSDTLSWTSLQKRPYPEWFREAKLGIFIHWGLYSVPAYGGPESYGEWYLLGLQKGDKTRTGFMKKNYGENFTYRDFAPLFKAELFDADEWASLFRKAGARYIVLVSKHHDGYCLWPSRYAPQWNSVDVGPHRDILGELKKAVEKKDIRFGIYYSLPEWNNPLHYWYQDPPDSIGRYVQQHMIPQFKEVITNYKPEVLFTDGEWYNTAEDWHAKELIAWYYDEVGPDAIVNDRWGEGSDIGFKTPEYSSGGYSSDRPWAEVRGLGRSFGLNRNEKLSAYMTSTELIRLFARTVAYGGGLIINVGPGADGQIPLLQQERLLDLGRWLEINNEAIYGASKWIKSGEDKPVSLERIDTCIDFNWVRNSPGYPIVEDHFTANWSGYIRPDLTGEYVFSAVADDGMKLYIDGNLILDLWETEVESTDSEAMRVAAQEEYKSRIFLEKGKFYPVKIEFREKTHAASISLYWENEFQPKAVVPKKNLFTNRNLHNGDGLRGEYRSMRQYIAYTNNHGNLYAICFEWPDRELVLPLDKPAEGTVISLLGREGHLPWRYQNGQLYIDVEQVLYNEMPGHHAWTFKIAGYTE